MKIPVSRPDLSALEREYLLKALDSSWISSSGDFVDTAQELIADASGKKYCVLTSNGTVAIHLALVALGINGQDEVIVPSFTFISSVNSVSYTNALPVFVDIDRNNWTIDLESTEAAITEKTKAIIAVNLYGHPANLDALKKLCQKYRLFLIEDNAEGLFAQFQSFPTGSFGDISTFSFFGNKILTSGEGGATTTDDEALYETMKTLRDHGMSKEIKYHFPVIGFNYRLTNLSASILVAQFERKNEILDKRRLLYAQYDSIFKTSKLFELQKKEKWATIAPWLYPIVATKVDIRRLFSDLLAKKGIETRPFFSPVHLEPPYEKEWNCRRQGSLNATKDIASRGLLLPTSSNFSNLEVEYIMSNVADVVDQLNSVYENSD